MSPAIIHNRIQECKKEMSRLEDNLKNEIATKLDVLCENCYSGFNELQMDISQPADISRISKRSK